MCLQYLGIKLAPAVGRRGNSACRQKKSFAMWSRLLSMREKAGKEGIDDIGQTSDTRAGLNLDGASVSDVLFPRALAESPQWGGPDAFVGHLLSSCRLQWRGSTTFYGKGQLSERERAFEGGLLLQTAIFTLLPSAAEAKICHTFCGHQTHA